MRKKVLGLLIGLTLLAGACTSNNQSSTEVIIEDARIELVSPTYFG